MSKNIVTEFLQSVSDDDLQFVTTRLTDKMGGDLPEVLNYMSKSRGIDHYFSLAKSATELFERCDEVRDNAHQECKRRNLKFKN
jgi:glutamine synthetase type III